MTLTNIKLSYSFYKYLIVILTTIILYSNSKAQHVTTDTIFNKLIRSNNGGWIAGDATYSIELPNNKTLWLFGDSFIGKVNTDNSIASGSNMIRNCAILMDGDSLRSIYGGTFENPSDFIETDLPGETWYWPEHGIVENDILKIFLAKFTTDPDGEPGWNFVHVGQDVASFSLPDIKLIDIKEYPYFNENEVITGNSIFRDTNHTYLYGRKEKSENNKIPYPHVARVENENSKAWEFYDGASWNTNPTTSKPINDFPVSQQYSVFKHLHKYILITQEIWLGTKIYSFTSNTPYGPWENEQLIYTNPILYENTFTYNAFAHPQFDKNNELLVSYNTNGDFFEIFNNVETYRPNFIRVPYALIDKEFDNTTGIIENKSKKINLKFSPNPISNKTIIEFTLNKKDIPTLYIYSLDGRLIKKVHFNNQSSLLYRKEIDISSIPSGTYLAAIKTQYELESQIIIKLF